MVLKYESIILTIHIFISKLLPVGVTVTVTAGGVLNIVVCKVSVVSKLVSKTHDHEYDKNRNIKANENRALIL